MKTGPRNSSSTRPAPAATDLRLAPFRFEVTPPLGHPCCGGLIKPVEVVDDALEALGIVLLGAGAPIVLCAVDWTGLLNEAHVAWRTALAEAAGTTPDRVAVHCVHQHNAPFACLDTERLLAAAGDLPHVVDPVFFQRCLDEGRRAVQAALPHARPVSHVGWGQGLVTGVASNRRVDRDASGQVVVMRGSACKDPRVIALPEGLIDPFLKTLAFFDGEQKVASLHYYATHPMSYYADGRVTSDFAGLARKQRQRDEPDCLHLYFTGAGGNIGAGKYNDGSKPVRPILTQRMYDGIVASESALTRVPVSTVVWKTSEILPAPLATLEPAILAAQIAAKSLSVPDRVRAAYRLAWLRRLASQTPIVLSCLHVGDARVLHLPGEMFIEYQLRAQGMQPGSFVCLAAYGDGGPWYIPVQEEYATGGYESSVAFCAPAIDALLTAEMQRLLTPRP